MALFKKEETHASSTSQERREQQKTKPVTKKEKAVSLKTDDITTILGKGSEFEGKLQFEGTLRIEGIYAGEIRSDSVLVVGEGAKVNAEIDIGTIIINGEVRGNVRAKSGVEIRQPGKLVGNIQSPSLIIDKGVVFEGNCVMENLDARKNPPPFQSKADPNKEKETSKPTS